MKCKWDDRFLTLAAHVAQWSKDPSTRVGAVLVGEDIREVALGYNGFPPGIEDSPDRLSDRPTKLRLTLHAERNVLDNARFSCRGSTLYATHPPCAACALSIVSRGVARVHVSPPSPDFVTRWHSEILHSKDLLREAGIDINF